MQEVEPMGTPDQADHPNEGRWLDSGSGRRGRGRGSRGRGGRGRGRGGRGLRGSGSSFGAELRTENIGSFEKVTRKYTRRGRTRGRGRGRRRGRRTARPRQRSENKVATIDKVSLLGSFITVNSNTKQARIEESPDSSGGEEWGIGESGKTYAEDDENIAGFESDENGQASGEDYDDQAAYSARGDYDEGKPVGLLDETEEEDGGDMERDEEGEEDYVDRDGHDLDAYIDDDDEEIGDNADDVGDAEGNGDEDDSASSFSSEYSD